MLKGSVCSPHTFAPNTALHQYSVPAHGTLRLKIFALTLKPAAEIQEALPVLLNGELWPLVEDHLHHETHLGCNQYVKVSLQIKGCYI